MDEPPFKASDAGYFEKTRIEGLTGPPFSRKIKAYGE